MGRRLFRIGRGRWEQKNGVFQPVLLERHVVREIVERLWLQARIKVWVINQPVGGKTAQNAPGIPDLVGWIPKHGLKVTTEGQVVPAYGTALYIEVKRPGGVRRPAQIRFIEEAVQGGCVAFFADSWECCLGELKKFGIDLPVSGRADGVRERQERTSEKPG